MRTPEAVETPANPTAPSAYPGPPPGGYPGPGNSPDPGAYPGPEAYPGPPPTAAPTATATKAYQSFATCLEDNLQVTARETGWVNAAINVLSDRGLLFSGNTGPNGEAFIGSATGPDTWANLRIESSLPPAAVQLGTISCP